MQALAKAGKPYGQHLDNSLKVCREYLPLFSGSLVNCVPHDSTELPAPFEKWKSPENMTHIRTTLAKMSKAVDVSLVQFLPMASREKEPNNTIVMNPSSAKSHKEWNIDYWRVVAKHCLDLGFLIFVNTHAPMPGLTDLDNSKVTYGLPNLQWLASMMRDAAAVISVDSGPLHLADAVDNPPIGLYTATSPITYGPYNDDCFVIDGVKESYNSGTSNTAIHQHSSEAYKRIQPRQVIDMLNLRLSTSI